MRGAYDGIGMTSMRTRARMVERLREGGIKDEEVLAAMAAVPRHIFVDEALASRAYEDSALPIGFGQTISSPQTVARMTELLRGGRSIERALEVGAGCGYQTAVLARVAREVYAIERLAPLVQRARMRMRELGLAAVRLRHGDGSEGWPDAAPFDAILVAAAAAQVPQALVAQIAAGGRMVIPIGHREQRLCLVERGARGVTETLLEAVRFVPLLGGRG